MRSSLNSGRVLHGDVGIVVHAIWSFFAHGATSGAVGSCRCLSCVGAAPASDRPPQWGSGRRRCRRAPADHATGGAHARRSGTCCAGGRRRRSVNGLAPSPCACQPRRTVALSRRAVSALRRPLGLARLVGMEGASVEVDVLGSVQPHHREVDVLGHARPGDDRDDDHRREGHRHRHRGRLSDDDTEPALPVDAEGRRDDRRHREPTADDESRDDTSCGEAAPPDAEQQHGTERRRGDGEGQLDGPRHRHPRRHEGQRDGDAHGEHRRETERPYAAPQARPRATAQQVLAEDAGDRDDEAGRGRQEGREGPRRDERGEPLAQGTVEDAARQHEHDGVGAALGDEVVGEHPTEHAVEDGQHVEAGEQDEHDEGRAASSPAVTVGVEADDDVRQAHRAEEGREHERVGEVEGVVAAGGARPSRRRRRRPRRTACGRSPRRRR